MDMILGSTRDRASSVRSYLDRKILPPNGRFNPFMASSSECGCRRVLPYGRARASQVEWIVLSFGKWGAFDALLWISPVNANNKQVYLDIWLHLYVAFVVDGCLSIFYFLSILSM